MCEPGQQDAIVAAMPASGHTKLLGIDRQGATVMRRGV
jgi:hypothetical protein